ncbi:MAG TPA: hypothetical protein VLJ14_12610 [Ktedonobacterales bacterium]|jgi:hypothetical protein|nr:hypothetical protein [Ktedonobacterales bacterium]
MQPKTTADQYIESLPDPADVRASQQAGQQAGQRDQERAIAARNEVKGDLVKSRAETEEQRKREQNRRRLLMVAQVAAAVVLPVLATLARNAWIRRRVRAQAAQAHHAHS